MQQLYTLTLEDVLGVNGADEIEEQKLINETTKEQFSVEKEENEEVATVFTITIKRCMKPEKN